MAKKNSVVEVKNKLRVEGEVVKMEKEYNEEAEWNMYKISIEYFLNTPPNDVTPHCVTFTTDELPTCKLGDIIVFEL